VPLFAFERRWLLAAFEAVLPSGAHDRLVLGAAEVDMDAFLVDLGARAPGRFLLGLRAAAWLIVLATPLALRRPCRFVAQPVAARERVLRWFAARRSYLLRELPMLVKMVACLGYADRPEVQRLVGYPEALLTPSTPGAPASPAAPESP
jgi:hypothetical protein